MKFLFLVCISINSNDLLVSDNSEYNNGDNERCNQFVLQRPRCNYVLFWTDVRFIYIIVILIVQVIFWFQSKDLCIAKLTCNLQLATWYAPFDAMYFFSHVLKRWWLVSNESSSYFASLLASLSSCMKSLNLHYW